MQSLQFFLDGKLSERKQANLYRYREMNQARDGAYVYSNQQKMLSFMSNDYLGLSQHTNVIKALQRGAELYGVGSSASNLLGGYSIAHKRLETALAEFFGYEKVLLFSTGYMANLAVISSLINKDDAIFADRDNHASLVDAGRYCGADFNRFMHLNCNDLNKKMAATVARHYWIVTDGVFSMDGSIAKLNQYLSNSQNYKRYLLVDDAHGIGVLGKQGKGSIEQLQLQPKNVDVLVGTFGKALGTFGAFVASDASIHEALVQFGRSYIYTTALPPAIAEASLASLTLLANERWRRDHLNALINYFITKAKSFNIRLQPSSTPIQTIILDNNALVMKIFDFLKNNQVLVGAIRPPTVPKNTARLRISLTVNHSFEDIDYLMNLLADGLWKNNLS